MDIESNGKLQLRPVFTVFSIVPEGNAKNKPADSVLDTTAYNLAL
jgi:hypothetical protein